MNPAYWLERAARVWPDRAALFHGAELVATYAQFNARAGRLAAGLQEAGINAGDRVAIFAANRVEYLIIMQAIWRIGAVAVPINYKLHGKEAAYILDHASAKICFTTSDQVDELSALAPSVRIVDLDGSGFSDLSLDRVPPPLYSTGSDDLVWLFYTSGTTGRPKGVMLTPGNLRAMCLSYFADVDAARSTDAKVYAAPMSHGAGLYQFIYMICGARHVVPASGGFDEREILDLADRLGDLCFFAAPTMVRRLVSVARERGSRGDGIRSIIYGGGPMYLSDIRDAIQQLGNRFIQIYGQGETPMTISVLTRADHESAMEAAENGSRRLVSVGISQATCQIAILGKENQSLAVGEVGEVAVKGPSVMKGYWNDPAATAAAIQDGWLRTGDMGALDEQGYLTLHDRSKDVIISGGTNIYPREVEEALLLHPSVLEASVIGMPDPEWGEIVVACIVPKNGRDLNEAELDGHCLNLIARFKRPKRYLCLKDLPKNAYGKVLKTELRKLL
ncbi:AMP-binding protein [Paracoccus sp. SCSIO 75233]|uniref:AMP-binding protein n=1 Tax=Paracoccus sp. SCSIO 75233 TaxID=3017782 RepID=UPI0022F1356F|nr:AMP-binding protein [Paracoccus sp. SCSIO 75233]WBU51892.1 AMP-binding protein [Paracoccus sp. SCSIO 75233]